MIREIGVDVADRVPHGLEQGDAEWADIVMTISCGDACPYVPGKRYMDWELSDPAGKPVLELRKIRDEIDRRVQSLLHELNGENAP